VIQAMILALALCNVEHGFWCNQLCTVIVLCSVDISADSCVHRCSAVLTSDYSPTGSIEPQGVMSNVIEQLEHRAHSE